MFNQYLFMKSSINPKILSLPNSFNNLSISHFILSYFAITSESEQ